MLIHRKYYCGYFNNVSSRYVLNFVHIPSSWICTNKNYDFTYNYYTNLQHMTKSLVSNILQINTILIFQYETIWLSSSKFILHATQNYEWYISMMCFLYKRFYTLYYALHFWWFKVWNIYQSTYEYYPGK